MIVLRSSFYFCLSFAILSIPFGDHTLFAHLYKKTAPLVNSLYETATSYGNKGLHAGKKYGEKLFSSSGPAIEDSVRESSAATTERRKSDPGPLDHYSDEERAMIKKLTRE